MPKGHSSIPRGKRGEYEIQAQMTFEEIGDRLGVSRQMAAKIYMRAVEKIRKSAAIFDACIELSEYNRNLRAKSAECIAAREHW